MTVYPDLPPIADFYVQSTVLRDPSNSNKAKIELIDSSYSPDGDYINQRIWQYKYDSDNDGSFDDESWVTLDSGNNINPVLYTAQVGKYLFELTVKESFGEETIPEFITSSDTRTDDTSDKPINDKISEVINLQPTVDFEMLKKRKADVVFTVGSVDSGKIAGIDSKITSIVQSKLAANNIDAQITSMRTQVIDTKTSFDWEKYDHGKGQIRGNDIYFYGYTTHGYSDFWYYDNQAQGKKTFTFVLNENQVSYHSFYGGGFIFGAKKYSDSTFEGYVLLFDQSTASIKRIPRVNMNSYSNTDGDFGYENLVSISKTKGVHNIEVQINDTKVKVWDNNRLIIDYTLPQKIGEGFGIVADHNSHNCDETSTFIFGSLVMKNETGKTLDEALKSTTWRENSTRFVVNISDIELPELNDSTKLANILSNMLSNSVYLVGLGTDANRSQFQTFVSRNDGKGVFYFNNNMDAALNQTADYIVSIIQSLPKNIDQYVLLGEQVTYNTYYSDPENDPKYTERWKYTHDPNYFENSLGLASFSGQYISGPVIVFDKVGKYDVIFQARDNPKNDSRFDNYRLWSYMPLNKLVLYVHRKPVAQYAVSMTPVNNIVTKTYQQQDIDFSGEGGHTAYWNPTFTAPSGEEIKTIEFKTAPAYDDRYEQQQVTGYKNGTWYVIKDYRAIHGNYSGAVSDVIDVTGQGFTQIQFYFVMHDSSDSASGSPDGSYYKITTTAGGITSYNVTLTSISYDLDHQSEPAKGIVQEEWKWKEVTATSWNTGKPTTLALNKNYLVWLRVKDKEGAWSDPYVKTLSTMNENLPPVAQFAVSPSTQVVNKPITIADQSYDPNGDQIAEWKWRVKKPDGTWMDYGGTKPQNITSLGTGTYTIELTVRDNPRVGTTLWSEPYTQTVTVIPENNKPVARFTIRPNPIIADETYSLNDTSYDPDGDPIVAREWKIQKPDGSWVTISQWKTTFEEMGLDDDGIYRIQLRVLDDPTRRHPALTPMWSDPYVVSVKVEGKLIVIGDSDKNVYRAGQALLLNARTEGRAFKVEARMWYPHNEYTTTNITTLSPDSGLTNPPQDVMTWHSRRAKAEGRDIIVIIPLKTPDGTYPVKFTAYKRKADGSTKTAEDTIYIKVKGTIYDYSHSEIIGK